MPWGFIIRILSLFKAWLPAVYIRNDKQGPNSYKGCFFEGRDLTQIFQIISSLCVVYTDCMVFMMLISNLYLIVEQFEQYNSTNLLIGQSDNCLNKFDGILKSISVFTIVRLNNCSNKFHEILK